jgi:hypothetical protein
MFPESLNPPTRELLAALGLEPLIRGFYLAGGSAIALHLGHRISVDLDFFTSGSCDAARIAARLQALGELAVQHQDEDTLVATVNEVQVSFFALPYPLLAPTVALGEVQIAGLLDLALMKLAAISQRGKRRGFVDLFTICQSGFELPFLLRRLPEKYAELGYPEYSVLASLTYFDDAEQDPPLQMLKPSDWGEVKAFFVREARRLAV